MSVLECRRIGSSRAINRLSRALVELCVFKLSLTTTLAVHAPTACRAINAMVSPATISYCMFRGDAAAFGDFVCRGQGGTKCIFFSRVLTDVN